MVEWDTGMGEITIGCRVNSIRPINDPYGNEFVCVEFAMESQKPPALIQFPKDVPQEVSAMIPIISQIPKMFPQVTAYTNRLTLLLTTAEWERLQRKFQFGEEAEIKVENNGEIRVRLI